MNYRLIVGFLEILQYHYTHLLNKEKSYLQNIYLRVLGAVKYLFPLH